MTRTSLLYVMINQLKMWQWDGTKGECKYKRR